MPLTPREPPSDPVIRRLLALVSEEGARAQVPGSVPMGQEAAAEFVRGLRRGLEELPRRAAIEEEARSLTPFAIEGLGAAALILDELAPRPDTEREDGSRLAPLLREPGAVALLLATGAGWALARLGRPRAHIEARLPPPLRGPAEDGYAFQRGLALPHLFRAPARFGHPSGDFDRGLGRALWFLRAGEPAALPRALAAFAEARRGPLLEGLGLAAAFTGGAPRALDALRQQAQGRPADAGALRRGVELGASLRGALGPLPAHTREALALLAP